MSFQFLCEPVEELDAFLTGLFDGAPLLVALGIALLLGLRHASDPDHLVAVTSLVAADDGDARGAARLGAWWGVGHAAALVALGVPLIVFKTALPGWLETGLGEGHRHRDPGAGRPRRLQVGARGLPGLGPRTRLRPPRPPRLPAAPAASGGTDHRHVQVRTRGQAVSIGLIHGLAGTGAVVVLLIAALPSRLEAALALAVFAPMSIASMAACTAAFAWVLTRPIIEPLYRGVLIPASASSESCSGSGTRGSGRARVVVRSS